MASHEHHEHRIPRSEHPKPLLKRDDSCWLNLNGPWKFSICPVTWEHPEQWEGNIEVPFCLQSPLSGALRQLSAKRKNELGLHAPPLAPSLRKAHALWYSKTIDLPIRWKDEVWLHVGACDASAEVFVNGKSIGTHLGGNTAFSFNITDALDRDGLCIARIELKTTDAPSTDKPCGKQLAKPGIYKNSGNVATLYSNISGVWQTIWLESRPSEHVTAVQTVAESSPGGWQFQLRADVSDRAYRTSGMRVEAVLFADRSCTEAIAQASLAVADEDSDVDTLDTTWLKLKVAKEKTHLWCPQRPHLYGLHILLKKATGEVVDKITSYAALRTVTCQGDQICLNGNPVFLRLVLDQGYYPAGLWTAPTSDALRRDIVSAQAMGFNGARLHQKVFEPLYFAHADELGFLVFCEYPDWNGGLSNRWETSNAYQTYVQDEWRTLIADLQNHPSIIAWGIFNEFGPKNGWDRHYGAGGGFKHRYGLEEAQDKVQKHHEFVRRTVRLVRKLDPQKRPIHDSSGWIHLYTDLWSFHDYEQKVDRWSRILDNPDKYLDGRKNQPLLVAEYGGVGFDAGGPFGLNTEKFLAGYSQRGCGLPSTGDEAVLRIEGLTAEIYKREFYAGFCYTQLYDVEFEKNGLLRYDRSNKFAHDLKKIFDGRRQRGRWSEAPLQPAQPEQPESNEKDPKDPKDPSDGETLPGENKRKVKQENGESKRSKGKDRKDGTDGKDLSEEQKLKKQKIGKDRASEASEASEKAKEGKEEIAETKRQEDLRPKQAKKKKRRKDTTGTTGTSGTTPADTDGSK